MKHNINSYINFLFKRMVIDIQMHDWFAQMIREWSMTVAMLLSSSNMESVKSIV